MPCFTPIPVWRGEKRENGKMNILFSPVGAINGYAKMNLPCGKCIGCRQERARQWAIRIMHEKQMNEESCFITLTYDDDHLPKDGSLNLRDMQLFLKKLRREYEEKNIRYFQCGEYGERFLRPHHHIILFGIDFRNDRDSEILDSSNTRKIVSSPKVARLWTHGFNHIGEVTYDSAAYVASYITKKKLGKGQYEHYNIVDQTTGEVVLKRKPEYVTMSRRPGIGNKFYEKFKDDIYPHDEVIVKGKPMKPPKYYDKLLSIQDPMLMSAIKERRIDNIDIDETSYDRLKIRHKFRRELNKKYEREYENGKADIRDL